MEFIPLDPKERRRLELECIQDVARWNREQAAQAAAAQEDPPAIVHQRLSFRQMLLCTLALLGTGVGIAGVGLLLPPKKPSGSADDARNHISALSHERVEHPNIRTVPIAPTPGYHHTYYEVIIPPVEMKEISWQELANAGIEFTAHGIHLRRSQGQLQHVPLRPRKDGQVHTVIIHKRPGHWTIAIDREWKYGSAAITVKLDGQDAQWLYLEQE